MNFIGKIFVVLIFIMSVIFMTLAAAVYSTHRDWEEEAKARKAELDESRNNYQRYKSERQRVESDLASQIEASRQQVRKLESERVVVVARNTSLQTEVDELRQNRRTAIAAVESTQQNNLRITDENTGLRSEIRKSQESTDQAFTRALAATEELHQTHGELENALERKRELTSQVAQMTAVMRRNDIDPETPVDAVKPRVDGFVSRISRNAGQQLIQVTIGADDGLKPGHTVEIFRNAKYLGRAEILKTSPDRAVGRINPRFLEGRIQEGDRVATRLKLG